MQRALLLVLLGTAVFLSGCINRGTLGDDDDTGDCSTAYPDVDGDGLGDPRAPVTLCEETEGYVPNGDDLEPECPTNDTDECGICAGGNEAMDCAGVCFGTAALDGCGSCAGGTTGVEPVSSDDWDGDGIVDACDHCNGDPVDRFIVEWSAVPLYSADGGPYSFEVELRSDGDILIQYGSLDPYESSASVGLQALGASTGLTLSHLDSFPLENPAVLLRWDGDLQNYVMETTAPPPANWYDLSAVGISYSLGDDDAVFLGLPFSFPFYDTTVDEIWISSNGFVWTGDWDMPSYENSLFPTAWPGGGMIAPFWDDLNPAAGGTIRAYHQPAECEEDCDGVSGGFARLDACDACVGGSTGLLPEADWDCAGVCFGEAEVDACGICAGGTTGVKPSDPGSCPQFPDLEAGEDYLRSTLSIDYVDVGSDSCMVAEGCVDDIGLRKVLRFGTRVGNIGPVDLYLGSPPGEHFVFDECHSHYHYADYASYELYDLESGAVAALGHKNGFCLLDSGIYDAEVAAAAGNTCNTYNCSNQGIGSGCQDTYGAGLSCQWVDITDVPDGTYELRVTVNPYGEIEELDFTNNTATAEVQIVGDSVTLVGP